MPWAKVRPGYEHGFAVVKKAGDVFEATEAELRDFADKLERVSKPVAVAQSADDDVPKPVEKPREAKLDTAKATGPRPSPRKDV